MCLYTKLIRNPKYKSTKKNGGNIPPILDERVKYVPIACGNCVECRTAISRDWQVRLLEDIKTHTNGKFITLTFSNESIKEIYEQQPTKNWPGLKEIKGYALDNAIATRAVRLFLENWRKKYKRSLRHWLVTELGHQGTENIHLHGIIWTDKKIDEIQNYWKYGHIWKGKEIKIKGKTEYINYVNNATINYITKYITKIDTNHSNYKPVVLTSAGIGQKYTDTWNATKNNFKDNNTDETYRTSTGHKIRIPIYWRNKIYNEEQREKLWLNKLDKQTRYVLGKKIDISKSEDEYNKALEQAKLINKELGYKDDTTDEDKKQYENNKRELLIKTRIANARKTR